MHKHDTIRTLLDKYQREPGALLPALHAIQEEIGFIPAESIATIADAFSRSRAEVHGVITFYHHFRTSPPARHQVRICRAEACQSMGTEQLIAHAEQALGCAMGTSREDGMFTLEPVFCLGHCAAAPAMMIDDAMHARVTPARFDALIAKATEAI